MGIVWARDPARHQDHQTYSSSGLVGYADSSYKGDVDNQKSITGYCFFFVEAITT